MIRLMRSRAILEKAIIVFLSMILISGSFVSIVKAAGDVPIEKGIVQEVGGNYVVVKIKDGNGFKDGTKLTFRIHKKTKIIMARSNTPITLSSILIGDIIKFTLGRIKIDKDGKITRYVDIIMVLGKK